MSDTPRTDAAISSECGEDGVSFEYVPADFARQLERELDKRERQLIDVQGQLITRNAELAEAKAKAAKWCGLDFCASGVTRWCGANFCVDCPICR
jgi:hypothetical protein